MPDDVSAVLNLPYIQPSQAQKHVTHNEALRLLDVLVQLVVTDRSLTVPPAAPGAGARYIVAAGAGGPWAGQEGAIALHEAGGWQFFAPQPGWSAHVLAEAVTVVFDGVQWRAPVEEPQLFSELGVNTSADATNRLAVAAAATLFSHVGDGHQMKINKAGPGATASLLFQSGWSGRAELGLAGSNDFSVKVSVDGGSFAEALRAEAETGRVLAPQGLLVAQGSAGAPGLGFAGDADTGLCRPAADQIGFATGGIQRALLSASALSLSVPLAGTAVTQGATDTTAGRLLKTGDFGLGVPIPLGSADNLDTLGSGLFYFNSTASNTSGNNYPISSAGALLNLRRSLTNWTQIFCTYVGAGHGQMFFRSQGAAGWSRWNEMSHSGRLLGTVSQSAGLPTGAVMERGSNANGEYVRFADGTQICTQTLSGATSGPTSWVYPAAFAAVPRLSGVALANVLSCLVLDAAPGVSSASFTLRDKADALRADVARLTAIGRWI